MLPYRKYVFGGVPGVVVRPRQGDSPPGIAVRHSACVPAWADPAIHLHESAEELYFLLQGRLDFVVAETRLDLRANEILLVEPGAPHAILGGEGLIEHIGVKAPATDDKRVTGDIPPHLPPGNPGISRQVMADWGYRIPLDDPANQNCWLLGKGMARFQASRLILAYLNFPTAEAATAGIGTRHQRHRHTRSWEYYFVLRGAKTLQIEDQLVDLQPGEIVGIPPQCCHALYDRQAPFEGFTIRAPVELDDKEICQEEIA